MTKHAELSDKWPYNATSESLEFWKRMCLREYRNDSEEDRVRRGRLLEEIETELTRRTLKGKRVGHLTVIKGGR